MEALLVLVAPEAMGAGKHQPGAVVGVQHVTAACHRTGKLLGALGTVARVRVVLRQPARHARQEIKHTSCLTFSLHHHSFTRITCGAHPIRQQVQYS